MRWNRWTVLKHVLIYALMVGMGQSPSLGLEQDDEQRPPRFTATQAASGSISYTQHCASCHGADLVGANQAPSLIGRRFNYTWRGRSLDVLAFHLRRMPPKTLAPQISLDNATYANLLAFILQSNGFSPGAVSLPTEVAALREIVIPELAGTSPDPDAPVVRSAAQDQRLKSLPALTDKMLNRPSPEDWLHWGRTNNIQNFSPLADINKTNIGKLKTDMACAVA